MSEHAPRILQPSQFHRTLECPGWGNQSRDIPDGPSSVFAMVGTIAHALAAEVLIKRADIAKYEGQYGETDGREMRISPEPFYEDKAPENRLQVKFDSDFIYCVGVYVDEIRRKQSMPGAICGIEIRAKDYALLPGVFGTVDSRVIVPFDALYIDDLKFGRGKMVEVGKDVGDNVQCSMYAAISLHEANKHNVERVVATIEQPRKSHPQGPIRSVEYPKGRLIQWAHEVAVPAIKAAKEHDAILRAGDWCGWCPAGEADKCPELKKYRQEAMAVAFTADLTPIKEVPGYADMSIGHLVKIVESWDLVKSWFSGAEVELKKRIMAEGEKEGYKCIQGYGLRRFIAEDKVKEALSAHLMPTQMYNTVFKSPAQMKKALTASGVKPKEASKILGPLVTVPLGEIKLVPSSDSQPALPPAAREMFGPADKK